MERIPAPVKVKEENKWSATMRHVNRLPSANLFNAEVTPDYTLVRGLKIYLQFSLHFNTSHCFHMNDHKALGKYGPNDEQLYLSTENYFNNLYCTYPRGHQPVGLSVLEPSLLWMLTR